MTNRLHGPTRWPSDPFVRKRLAEADIGFTVAMRRLGFHVTPELVSIEGRARRVLEHMRGKA